MAEYRRFFADETDRHGDNVCIAGNEFNHIKKVLRLKPSDEVVICFNDGIDNLCEITEITEKQATLKIKKSFKNNAELDAEVTLFQACMKGDKMDFCIQKAVELGVTEIVPFESRFTVAKFDCKKTERYERIAFEASKQCGRAKLTKVCDGVKFNKLTSMFQDFDVVVYCNEYEKENAMLDTLLKLPKASKLAVVIGSEGGFSKEEESEILSAKNVISVSFGKRILRAETAGVFALSLLTSVLSMKKAD